MAKDDIVPGSDDFVSSFMNERERAAINSDPATELARKRGQFIEIFHIPSGQSVKFKAYITDFQDKYESEWQSAPVYGRMDPIHQYQGTKRIISLDWEVPSMSIAEAKLNHQKMSLLFSMLYPSYDAVGANGSSNATSISTSPIFRLKFANLIQDPTTGEEGGEVETSGLVGAISGFIYAPDFSDMGFIDNVKSNPSSLTRQTAYGTLYPKLSKLSLEYTVFHTFQLGWDGREKRTKEFPYGVDMSRTVAANEETASGNMQEIEENIQEAILRLVGGVYG